MRHWRWWSQTTDWSRRRFDFELDEVEKLYGKAATAFLVKWTNAGDLTLRTFKDDRGKFGRILGELWYGREHNINQLLVDNHHAVRYHGQSKEEIKEEHLANREKLNLEIVQSFE